MRQYPIPPCKAYIAGPMTGKPSWNFPAFFAEAAVLRAEGFEVINPAELDDGDPETLIWSDCLKRDIPELVRCQAIVLLPGWSESRGAQLEHHVACELGLQIVYPLGWL